MNISSNLHVRFTVTFVPKSSKDHKILLIIDFNLKKFSILPLEPEVYFSNWFQQISEMGRLKRYMEHSG